MELEPPVPGLPEGRRSSINLREPNRERLLEEARTASQSATRSMKWTSRSSKPARLARARIASAASPTSSASSPEIRYALAGSPVRWEGRLSRVSFKGLDYGRGQTPEATPRKGDF